MVKQPVQTPAEDLIFLGFPLTSLDNIPQIASGGIGAAHQDDRNQAIDYASQPVPLEHQSSPSVV